MSPTRYVEENAAAENGEDGASGASDMNSQASNVGAASEVDTNLQKNAARPEVTTNDVQVPTDAQPHIQATSELVDWVDTSFCARSAVEGVVTGRTRGHFGVFKEHNLGKWMVVHLPTTHWIGLACTTPQEAEACCTILEELDTDWATAHPSAARKMAQRLKGGGLAHMREYRAQRRAIAFNRDVIFDALAAALVTRVTVTFDGYDGDGPDPSLTASGVSGSMELPSSRVVIKQVQFRNEDLIDFDVELSAGIERLSHDCVEAGGADYETGYMDDGGSVNFDVRCRTILMIVNRRREYVETEAETF